MARSIILAFPLTLLAVMAPAIAAQEAPPEPPPPTVLETIVRSAGAALVGGWVGFVGAQVAHSDWDRPDHGDLRQQRTIWIAAGAALGILSTRVVPGLGAPGTAIPGPPQQRGRAFIVREEIQRSSARHALELVEVLRPEWLVVRGTQSIRETARGEGSGGVLTTTPGKPTIMVYMDGLRLGGLDTMADIPVLHLTQVEFLDAHRASVRLGSGNTHGAILLSTGLGAP